MVILRAMGYTQPQIAEEFELGRSAISKQFGRIRQRCKESDDEFGDEWGFLRIFFEILIDSEDLECNGIVAFANRKFTYENLRYQKMSKIHALSFAKTEAAVMDPPWIANPDFKGSHISARNILAQLWSKNCLLYTSDAADE